METQNQTRRSSYTELLQATERVVKYFDDNQRNESFVGTLEVNGNIKVSGPLLTMCGRCHSL